MCTIGIVLELLKNQGKTQKQLCDALGIGKQTFSNWKSGISSSYTKYLSQIADFFEVSVDYLLNKNDYISISFWNKFVELCSKKQTTPTKVVEELGLGRGSVTHWKNGRIPHGVTLNKIANYFGVTVEYLKGEEVAEATFKERFIKICTEKGVAPTYVCKKIGLSSATFSQWDDNSMPRATTLHKISNYLGVTVEYLKGEEKAEATVENEYPPIDEQEMTLLKLFRGTTQEGRMRIIQAVLNICDEIDTTALNGKNYSSAG